MNRFFQGSPSPAALLGMIVLAFGGVALLNTGKPLPHPRPGTYMPSYAQDPRTGLCFAQGTWASTPQPVECTPQVLALVER